MLTELCAVLRNYFLRDYSKDIHAGTFVISGGIIEPLSFLRNGQYYRIVNSVFNDGVHRYGDSSDVLVDETFEGAVWAMTVPPAVIALSSEIDAWKEANAETLASPYQSESFGGYSYSLKASGRETNISKYGWQDHFADKLALYRRTSVL